jgi:two-component system OmpR family sensor kinase
MTEPDSLGTEAPDPPWRRHRGDNEAGHAKGGPFRRLSERTSLRTKLIVAVLGLVIMALAAIGVASTYIARESLLKQHDTDIESVLSNPAQTKFLVNNSALSIGAAATTKSNIVVGLQQPGQQLAWAQSNFGFGNTDPLPELPTDGLWAGSRVGDTTAVFSAPAQSGPNTWRVMAETITVTSQVTGANSTVTLVIAEDIGNIDALTMRLILFDLAVGLAIVIVLAVLGIGVVRANLRPLDDIELTAGQIAKGHLNHRVPEGDPRTEIGSLGRSLNTMLSQIEQAFHAQEESEQAAHESEERMRRFIADASHELRTPLTTIRGFAAHYRMRGGAGGGRRVGSADRGVGLPDQEQSSRTDALVPQSANGSPIREYAPDGPGRGGGSGDGSPSSDGMPPEELDHLIARVEAEATRMGLLVEDLLTLARLDPQRPLNLAPVDVLTLAADAVQDARIVSPGRPIDLIVAPGTAFLVNGDEPRLRQVLGNLVNNAITHTPAGTPVRVKIAAGTLPPTTDGRGRGPAPAAENGFANDAEGVVADRDQPVPAVVLDIEDDGPGMPAEQAQRVFERFYRADAARNRASGGTGLGLAIVAGLVTAHGGTVSVRTAPGRGADFQVRLPLSPDALASSDDPDDALPD